MSTSAQRSTTAIAWAFPDRVIVRAEDLCSSLIGHLSLTEYFHFLLLGHRPNAQQRILLDACFVALAEHGLVPSVQAARMTLAAAPEAWQGAVAAGLLGCGSVILGSSEVAGRLLAEIVSEAKVANVSLGETAALRVAATAPGTHPTAWLRTSASSRRRSQGHPTSAARRRTWNRWRPCRRGACSRPGNDVDLRTSARSEHLWGDPRGSARRGFSPAGAQRRAAGRTDHQPDRTSA